MSRPICFHCGRQLMYVKGKPVFAVYVDPIGAEHKLHKFCFKHEGYANSHSSVSIETIQYNDGTSATGVAPLPRLSPQQQGRGQQ